MIFNKFKLGEFVDTISDTTKINKDKVILINTSDVLEGIVTNHEYTDNKNLKGQFKKRFKRGDILYSEIRPANKRFAYIDFDSENYIASTKLMVLRSKNNIDNRFLYNLLSSNEIINKLHEIAVSRSGTFPQITFTELSNLEVSIPDYKDQIKIGKFIDLINKKITLNTKINNNLYKLSNSLFKNFFEENEIKEYNRLDEISDCQNGHAFYKEGYDDTGLMVVDLGNVNLNSNFIYTNADKYINRARIPNEKFIVKKNDLVMIMTDRKATMDLLGKTAKIYENKEYALNQRIYRIRSKINVNYLYTYLNSDKVSNELKSKALGSVQKYINTNVINEIMVPLFEDEIMEKFSNIVNPIFEYMENNILENKTLEQLRDTLLPKLMNGEIDLDNIEI